MFVNILLILIAYLSGSIASAILICKLFGLTDPRNDGSGNPGATNMMRLYGKKVAIMTLVGDVLKGVIPVLLARSFSGEAWMIALCGFSAFLGHLFPIFFNFKGGKGVATLIGLLFATHYLLGLAYIATWLLMTFAFRYSSLSALTAALLTPAYSWFILQNLEFLISYALMAVILIWRHQSNIRKLVAGTESKIGIK